MSFQLVLTHSSVKPSTESEARLHTIGSTTLPEELAAAVVRALPLDRTGRYRGVYYGYRTKAVEGDIFHILSRFCPHQEEEHSLLIHSLILSPEEVENLHESAARPTPAGIILALESIGFWRSSFPESPKELDKEPKMTASALPYAADQATWKRLTGHKSNARAFFTSPYDKECLFLIPPGADNKDVLMLLHESDWLTTERGWGHTFTTHGEENDRTADTQRIAIPDGFPIGEIPSWSDLPILLPNHDLVLKDEQVVHKKHHVALKCLLPYYRYVEADDYDFYPVQKRTRNRFQRLLFVIGCLLFLSVLINWLVVENVSPDETPVDIDPVKILTGQNAGEAPPGGLQQNTGEDIVVKLPPSPIPSKDSPAVETPDLPIPPTDKAGNGDAGNPQPIAGDAMDDDAPWDTPQWRMPGQALPPCVLQFLAQQSTKATVYLLGGNGGSITGKLAPANATGAKFTHLLTNNKGRSVELNIELKGNALLTCHAQGEAAAILLKLEQGEILLMPATRVRFDNMSGASLPEISISLLSSRLGLDKQGELTYKSPISSAKPVPFHATQSAPIILPPFANVEQRFSYRLEEGLPIMLRFGNTVERKGCYQLPVKPVLCNPFHGKAKQIFKRIATTQLLTPEENCTYTALYHLAEQLQQGQDVERQIKQYRSWRKKLMEKHIVFPTSMDVAPDAYPDLGGKIKEAICTAMGNELQTRYQREREIAESFDKPVELILEQIETEDDATTWVFLLQTVKD